MNKSLIIPALGDDARTGGEIISLPAIGDRLACGDIYIEIETDKVVVEVPCEFDGVVTELKCKLGDKVCGGDIAAMLEVAADADAVNGDIAACISQTEPERAAASLVSVASSQENRGELLQVAPVQPVYEAPATEAQNASLLSAIAPAGPAARHLARTLGVDLSVVMGTGARGRISKEDVKHHAKIIIQAAEKPAGGRGIPRRELPDIAQFGAVHRAEMSGIARATSDNMQFVWSTVPHAWVEEEIDVSDLESLRKAVKRDSREPMPLTMTAILCKLVALALHDFPKFNSVFDEQSQQLIVREYVNVGIAVDTPRGLLVPGIRDADKKSAISIANEIKVLADKGQVSKLSAEDLKGNGFTISNLGGIGATRLCPLVNWPEVAIIGVGSARDRLMLVNDKPENRKIMALTLGFDHRVINGAEAARFLAFLKEMIEQPGLLLIKT
ncbi:dihydrolipoamide acetyltransferase family protein [Zhongshania guokunii]|uniref:Dihydrolipoamide acetyltransferase component of pyruvate dehydrogenase complex n=1 Tax=Zhongshania guokunii TaxID=641783 RepID=A0ABV3UC41_9GAMM